MGLNGKHRRDDEASERVEPIPASAADDHDDDGAAATASATAGVAATAVTSGTATAVTALSRVLSYISIENVELDSPARNPSPSSAGWQPRVSGRGRSLTSPES
jgi:hypothetical protein